MAFRHIIAIQMSMMFSVFPKEIQPRSLIQDYKTLYFNIAPLEK